MSSTEHAYEKDNPVRHEQDHSAKLERQGVPREHAPEFADEGAVPKHNYDEFSDQDLADRAQELDIEGHDSMLNDQLIEAIRKKEEPDRVDATRAADQAEEAERPGRGNDPQRSQR